MEQFPQLSNREWDVVNLLREGKSNKMIASALGISERTVEFHLKNVYEKTQVGSRVELVLKLGESTVTEKREIVENGDDLNSRSWATSLREAVSTIGKDLRMTNILKVDDIDPSKTLTFPQAIRICFAKYAEFDGRATRAEFWWFALFVTLATSGFTYLSEAAASIFLIAVLLPFLAAGARRLHDANKSAWWLWFLPVPVGGLVILAVLWAMPSYEKLPEDSLSL